MKTARCNNIADCDADHKAKQILKSELAKRGISYQKLGELLNERGWNLNKPAIDNRMARGTFSADFFLDCLRVIGCESLPILPEQVNPCKGSK